MNIEALIEKVNEIAPKFKNGDYIYYYHKKDGDTYPGVVLRYSSKPSHSKLQVVIRYDGLYGDVITTVNECQLELQ